MNTEILHLETWKNLTDRERLNAARWLPKYLPLGFKSDGIEIHSMGDQKHSVAFYDWNPTHPLNSDYFKGRFALIPGADVVLGYDRQNPFMPSPAQSKAWQSSEYGGDTSRLHWYLDKIMTPLRQVSLRPFLIEVSHIESQSELSYVLEPGELVQSHRSLGFRSPTSDGWEYACSAGSQTLWRWGNDCPLHVFPLDVLEDDYHGWNLSCKPNAFGLKIAFNDYDGELCEDGIQRGGDFGGSTCGGAGYMSAWLTLASAYFQNYGAYESCLSTEPHDGSRRVFPLS